MIHRNIARRMSPCIMGVQIFCLTAAACFAQTPAGGGSSEPSSKPVLAEHHWPQWRGPLANGVAPHAKPPVRWSDSENIRWKVAIPGRGHATPIVWGDRVYIQTAIQTDREGKPAEGPDGEAQKGGPQPPGGSRGGIRPTKVHRFVLMALDRATGKTVWEKTLREEVPHESGHQDASQASPSPLTDGQYIYAYFGSYGLYCLDMTGQVRWEKDLGDMRTRNGFGEGSSPTLVDDMIVINWDNEDGSFIVALDAKTGAERWRKAREENTSWATPLVVDVGGKKQVVVPGANRIRAYDPANGEVIWSCGGLTANVIPTPVTGHGMVYLMSGFRGAALLAIRLSEARGDITDSSAIAWKYDRDTPYVPSPVLSGDRLYFLQINTSTMTCLNARNGEKFFGPQRIEPVKGVYASLLCAGGHIYVVGRNGHTVVLKDASTFEIVSDNALDDVFNASPAVAGDELFLRGEKFLYCIAKQE